MAALATDSIDKPEDVCVACCSISSNNMVAAVQLSWHGYLPACSREPPQLPCVSL